MTASLKCRSCSRAISCTMSTIQASPASEPDVPDEPMISGIPALTARVIMISVSRLTAAAENMQMPVASGPGPGSVLPASQPIIRAPSEIALSSDSARNPEPSMPVAETSGNDAIATLLDLLLQAEDTACPRSFVQPRGDPLFPQHRRDLVEGSDARVHFHRLVEAVGVGGCVTAPAAFAHDD